MASLMTIWGQNTFREESQAITPSPRNSAPPLPTFWNKTEPPSPLSNRERWQIKARHNKQKSEWFVYLYRYHRFMLDIRWVYVFAIQLRQKFSKIVFLEYQKLYFSLSFFNSQSFLFYLFLFPSFFLFKSLSTLFCISFMYIHIISRIVKS